MKIKLFKKYGNVKNVWIYIYRTWRRFLACGYVAKGRLEEPEIIITRLQEVFAQNKPLKGKKLLVTAGPTREKIDPVRFMTNFSSGKMGYALAEVAAELGAEVILVSGPTALTPPANVTTVQVQSAQDMLEAVLHNYHAMDVVIKTAAVANYRRSLSMMRR